MSDPLQGGDANAAETREGPAAPVAQRTAGSSPRQDYHDLPAWGSTAIREWVSNRRLAWERFVTKTVPPVVRTRAMVQGTAVHAVLLEPDTAQVLALDQRTTAGKEAAADPEVIALRASEYDPVMRMAEAVLKPRTRAAEVARAIVTGVGRSEVELSWWTGMLLPCKGLIDRLLHDGTSVEVKTCLDPSPEGFARDCWAYRWDLQAAHYRRGLQSCYDEFDVPTLDCPWTALQVLIGNVAPYAVGVYSMDSLIDAATPELEAAYASLSLALASWDDESLVTEDWEQEIQPGALPPWARKERGVYDVW